MARKKLGEMLVDAGAITEQGLRMALNEQRRWGGPLGRILVDMKAVSESELVASLSAQLQMPAVDLDKMEIHPTVLELVPGDLAERHNIIPFAQPMKFLDVAMAEPTNLGIIDELRIRTQLNIRPHLAGPKMIERALAKHYRRGFGARLRTGGSIPLVETGDMIAAAPGIARSRPSTAEVDAAQRREGLRPHRQTRTPPLDVASPSPAPSGPVGPPPLALSRDAEIDALQDRISALEALVARDEDVLRKVLRLLIDKGIATREEILERIR
jgi:hypothetical protein